MRITVAAIGQRMPGWVSEAWREYTRRLPGNIPVDLRELALARRGRNADVKRIRVQEGKALLAAVPAGARIVALDACGEAWSTAALARRMEDWLGGGRDMGFLIGGPDGLAPQCLQSAEACWSLGPLTLPHPLVRVILAEQLYRAWSITAHHPYHRA